ncbi:MAG: hypothetical protein IT181_12995 [Acidobacteria bacterium]|nr:hypothetical protein [Acidobacteriota bacterium]
MDTRTVSQVLTCQLTDDEQRERGRQLAEALRAVGEEELDQKAQKERMKERLEALHGEVTRLGGIVRAGEEERAVQVRLELDDEKGMVHSVRLDTGELFHSRPMTQQEKQRALPFVAKAAGA